MCMLFMHVRMCVDAIIATSATSASAYACIERTVGGACGKLGRVGMPAAAHPSAGYVERAMRRPARTAGACTGTAAPTSSPSSLLRPASRSGHIFEAGEGAADRAFIHPMGTSLWLVARSYIIHATALSRPLLCLSPC
jgi:hypothetical protein